jgi:hypothetical protein
LFSSGSLEGGGLSLVVHDPGEGFVQLLPLDAEAFEDVFSDGRELIKAFVSFILFAPDAYEEALRFEAAEQGVKGVFVDFESEIGEGFAEDVAILFGAKLGEDCEDERAAAQFEAEVVEEFIGG